MLFITMALQYISSVFMSRHFCNVFSTPETDNTNVLFSIVATPARIEEFLKKEKSVAAVRIQTLWRGHRERLKFTERQSVAQQVKAAIKIQRVVSGEPGENGWVVGGKKNNCLGSQARLCFDHMN